MIKLEITETEISCTLAHPGNYAMLLSHESQEIELNGAKASITLLDRQYYIKLYTDPKGFTVSNTYFEKLARAIHDRALLGVPELKLKNRTCPICGGEGTPTGAGPDSGYEGPCHYGPYLKNL